MTSQNEGWRAGAADLTVVMEVLLHELSNVFGRLILNRAITEMLKKISETPIVYLISIESDTRTRLRK